MELRNRVIAVCLAAFTAAGITLSSSALSAGPSDYKLPATTFKGPVTAPSGFVGPLTGNVTGNVTGTAAGLSGTLGATVGGTVQSTYAAGDMLYASGTNTLAKRAAGLDSQVLRIVSGLPTWTHQVDPSHLAIFYDDFTGYMGLIGACSGSSCIANIRGNASSAARPGVYRLTGGTATNGYGNIYASNQDDYIKLGGGTTYWETAVNLSALSNGTDTYTATCGLSTGPYGNTLPSTNGIYFWVNSNTLTNWQLKTTASSSTTTRDTGVVAATGWTKLGWELNSAGTSVQAYINGVAAGAPITATIPTASVQFQCMILKSAGTGIVNFDIDYHLLIIVLATPR